MVIKGDYDVGQEAIYLESGMRCRVNVIGSTGDETRERYKLEVLEVLRENPMFNPPEVGYVFDCDKDRTSQDSGLWSLVKSRF